jgi:hypothetical protein
LRRSDGTNNPAVLRASLHWNLCVSGPTAARAEQGAAEKKDLCSKHQLARVMGPGRKARIGRNERVARPKCRHHYLVSKRITEAG